MKLIPRMGAIGASVALAAAAFLAATPAGAETHDIDSDLTGSLTVHIPVPPTAEEPDPPDVVADLPFAEGSTFVGTYDDASGELTGTVAIADGTATAGIPGLGDADLSFTFEPSEIQDGMIDEEGNVSYTTTQYLSLREISVAGNASPIPDTCTFGLIDMAYTGTYDAETGEIDVSTSEPFGISTDGLGGEDCGPLTGVILDLLGPATVDGVQQFILDIPEPEPTTTTTTTTTTVPAEPVTTIDAGGIVSSGCDVSVPIDFAEAGEYTLVAMTADNRNIGSTSISRDAAGPFTAHLTIDENHGTQRGDIISFILTDASGAQVAEVSAPVQDPDACRPAVDEQAPSRLVTTGAQPATPVAAQPSYTG